MALFPLIEFNRNDGASVTMKLPDTVDLWTFLGYMDRVFMGLTEESMIANRREFDVWKLEQNKGKGRK